MAGYSSDMVQCFEAVVEVLKEILEAIYGADFGLDSGRLYEMWDSERRKRAVMTGGNW